MSIDSRIAELEAELSTLKRTKTKGYYTEDGFNENYYFQGDHIVVLDTDDIVVGVICNSEVMDKFIKDTYVEGTYK